MAHDLVTELLQYSSLACFMPIWQLCANLLIPNCLRSNLSYSPLTALELYVKDVKPIDEKKKCLDWYFSKQIWLKTIFKAKSMKALVAHVALVLYKIKISV